MAEGNFEGREERKILGTKAPKQRRGSPLLERLARLMLRPEPFRATLTRHILNKLRLFPLDREADMGLGARPHYNYCVYQAARLASLLGIPQISVIEFGVAGGNGLVCLEDAAVRAMEIFPVEIEIYGFDTGLGLPKPRDNRDLPFIWQESHFRMDRTALEARLKIAKLVLGDVGSTRYTFFAEMRPAPIAAVVFDLDYYSSTVEALEILNESWETHLPRVFCYFDDLISSDLGQVCEFNGVPLAIAEFNARNSHRKYAKLNHLRYAGPISASWREKIFSFHDQLHPQYPTYLKMGDRQLMLNGN